MSTTVEDTVELRLRLYRQMLLIRRFEERVIDLYARGQIPGIGHVSIGQEAVPVGVCAVLTERDHITSTHRGHGHCLAKGARPDRMFAELFGRVDGYCRGRGGSMHIADPATGNLGANAIVGGSLGIAAGAAFTAKRLGNGTVAACFFGDGAINEGIFSESINLAAIWRLPVLYVCENNHYGEYTPASQVTGGDMTARGAAVGVPSVEVDGMNVLAVREAADEAASRARGGGGPTLLVCNTYRFLGHGMSDPNRPYRTREEEHEWRALDPIEQLARELDLPGGELEAIDASVGAEIEAGVEFASASPLPGAEAASDHVFGESNGGA
jgi:TPP-dependent pyruvate/acetoin dehydrogenase alpha subunit